MQTPVCSSFSRPPPPRHHSTNFMNTTADNFQSITGSTLNNDFNDIQTVTAQTKYASPFLYLLPEEFQHAQLTAKQSCVKISIHLCKNILSFDCPCMVQPLVTSRYKHLARRFCDPTLSEHAERGQDTH